MSEKPTTGCTGGMQGLDLQGIADMVHAADTPDAAWQASHAALARQGLRHACLHVDLPRRAANPFADHPGARSFGTFWDPALDSRLRGYRGYRGDVRRARAPELWHLRPSLTYLSLFFTPMFIDHLDMLARPRASVFAPISNVMLEMGQHQVLAIPLAAPGSRKLSCLNLWGDEEGGDFAAFAQAHMGALQAAGLCLAAFLALRWPSRTAPRAGVPRQSLSARERQILCALARGDQLGAIADDLGISDRSAREYLARARAKLDARTRTEAVARALTLGLIDPFG